MKAFLTRRQKEITVTAILAAIAVMLLLIALASGARISWQTVLQSIAFALFVALSVRWLNIVFEETQPVRDVYATSKAELIVAIQQARSTIWICQTWLPGAGGDATMILDRHAPDTRLLLASFDKESPIWARIKGRADVDEDLAKSHSAASARQFIIDGRQHEVRFNPIHHPGWIAVLDSEVFWGATPVERDNWTVDLFFHRAPSSDPRAKLWIAQFKLLWENSHSVELECQHNTKLKGIPVGDRRKPKSDGEN
jgi:hypothetical protein